MELSVQGQAELPSHTQPCDFQVDLSGDEKISGCWGREAHGPRSPLPGRLRNWAAAWRGWKQLPLKWEVMIRQGPGAAA